MLKILTSSPNTYLICPDYRLTSWDKITQERSHILTQSSYNKSYPTSLFLSKQRRNFKIKNIHWKTHTFELFNVKDKSLISCVLIIAIRMFFILSFTIFIYLTKRWTPHLIKPHTYTYISNISSRIAILLMRPIPCRWIQCCQVLAIKVERIA